MRLRRQRPTSHDSSPPKRERKARYQPVLLPRRILFVTESFGIGGTENHLLDLLPALKERGFDVAAFCFTEKSARAATLEAVGIQVHAAPQLGHHRRSLLAPFRIAGGAISLFALIKRFRPSIVHFYLPGPYIAGAPAAIAAGAPIKIMSRRSMGDYQKNWRGAGRAERLLHAHMDAVIGNSRAVVQELVAKEGGANKVHLIYNGVRLPSLETRVDARAKLGLDRRAFVATMVANLFSYKGHLDLIAALAAITDRLPQPWVVLCAGRDGGCAFDIARAICDSRLGSNVRLLGERNDIPLLLAASDIGLLTPTRNEGFSNAVLESMAAGLPMIVTDVGGNAEAVVDGETGLVVPPQDAEALSAAVLKLARDPDLRRLMGERASQRAAEQFSLAATVEQYCVLYENLLADRGAASGQRHPG